MSGERSDNVIDITWDLKKAEWKNRIRNAAATVGRFVSNNKTEVIAVATPILGKLVLDGVRNIRASSRRREQQHLKENYIWDPSTGMWFETRKKMSSNQRTEFSKRKANGESVADILNSMKILK